MIGQKGIPAIYGGVERHVEEISTRLARKGHEVTVYARSYYMKENKYEEIKGKIDLGGTNIKIFPTIHSKHLDAIVHCIIATFYVLWRRYDIVHFHALGPSLLSFFPRLFGSKTVVTVHGLDWMRSKWNKFASYCLRIGEKTSYYFPNRTIAVSRTLKKYYDQKYNADILYIPNGNTMRVCRSPRIINTKYGLDKESYIIFVSRLVPEKGCHYLIDAFKKLNTDKKLVIVGGSSYTTHYVKTLKESAGNDPRILFTGFLHGEELEELFSNAYFFVLPSEMEGLPLVILEALTYERCVLASDIPENMEIIAPEGKLEFGFSFKNKDVNDLSEKMDYLLTHSKEVREASRKSVEYITENFDWDKITNRLETLYYSLVTQEE